MKEGGTTFVKIVGYFSIGLLFMFIGAAIAANGFKLLSFRSFPVLAEELVTNPGIVEGVVGAIESIEPDVDLAGAYNRVTNRPRLYRKSV